MPRSSPTVRKRRLAGELKRLRKESGKNREETARYVGCSPVTITRIESAQTAGTVPIVARMLEFYGVTGQRLEMLMALCREARKRGWWHQYGDSIPQWFEVYLGLEEEASAINTYQPEAVYGLLQTPAYAYALMQTMPQLPPEEEIKHRVAVRMKRQERLHENDAPRLWVVLSESALRREVGGPEVMHEQLMHLIELTKLNSLTVQILPFSAGAHPGTHGGFEMLGFPESADPDVVYVEYWRGGIYLENPADIAAYTELFDHLRARALGPDDSRELIRRVAQDITA